MTDTTRFFDAAAATWPAATLHQSGPFTIRHGAGGGLRVSSATLNGSAVAPQDIATAETQMRATGQQPSFMIRPGEDDLDALLAQSGYQIDKSVIISAAPVDLVAADGPAPISAFTVWEPVFAQYEIWADMDIGPERLAVMNRVNCPKTSVFGRAAERPVGAAFVAVSDSIAFCHALAVRPDMRRMKAAINMMRAAAVWARQQGAQTFAVQVESDNSAARALFATLGMHDIAKLHIRVK